MKQAITGSKLFNGIDFIEHKALLIEDQHIAGIVNKDAIPTDFQVKNTRGGHLVSRFY